MSVYISGCYFNANRHTKEYGVLRRAKFCVYPVDSLTQKDSIPIFPHSVIKLESPTCVYLESDLWFYTLKFPKKSQALKWCDAFHTCKREVTQAQREYICKMMLGSSGVKINSRNKKRVSRFFWLSEDKSQFCWAKKKQKRCSRIKIAEVLSVDYGTKGADSLTVSTPKRIVEFQVSEVRTWVLGLTSIAKVGFLSPGEFVFRKARIKLSQEGDLLKYLLSKVKPIAQKFERKSDIKFEKSHIYIGGHDPEESFANDLSEISLERQETDRYRHVSSISTPKNSSREFKHARQDTEVPESIPKNMSKPPLPECKELGFRKSLEDLKSPKSFLVPEISTLLAGTSFDSLIQLQKTQEKMHSEIQLLKSYISTSRSKTIQRVQKKLDRLKHEHKNLKEEIQEQYTQVNEVFPHLQEFLVKELNEMHSQHQNTHRKYLSALAENKKLRRETRFFNSTYN